MNVKPLIVAICLSGCANDSQVQLQRKLTQFEDGPVTAMIERFGPPSQQTEVEGQRWYVWSSSQESFALAYYMGYENDSSYRAHCKVSAEVHHGTVLQVRREGNLKDCEWLGLI